MSYPSTIQDLVRMTYGQGGAQFAAGALTGLLQKSDDPLISSDAGIINPMYGKVVWDWLNKKATLWSLLPKKPWERSGFRVITADRSGKVTGVAEDGTLPDTDHPTRLAVLNQLSQGMTRWEVSRKASLLSEIEDGIDAWPQERAYQAEAHVSGLNEQIFADAYTAVDTSAATDKKGNDFETLDRMISSGAEEGHRGGTGSGQFDVYAAAGDRDSGTTFDSVVDENNDTDRPLTLKMINDLIKSTVNNGADPDSQFFVTGLETLHDWEDLLGGYMRWEEARVTKGLNGVSTQPGSDVGFMVSAYKGRPIFTDIDVPEDGAPGIYLVDKRFMYLKIRVPTIYVETDPGAHMLLQDKLKRQAAFITTGQLECTRFNVHGKIRDLE